MDIVFGALGFTPAAPVSWVYFGANFFTLRITGKSIGDNIEDNYHIVPIFTAGGPSLIFVPKK